MMEILNDDCQLLIISYLDLISQFRLWVASKNFAPQIYNNLCYAWQRQPCHKLSHYMIEEFATHGIQSELDFIAIISPTVRDLRLRVVYLRNLERWRGLSFPLMETLHFTLKENGTTKHDRALELIVELFPRLRSFKSAASINGQIIEKLTMLQSLDLMKSVPINVGVSVTKFQQLEHLKLNEHFLSNNPTGSIMSLPKLRSLCFRPKWPQYENILKEIVELRGQDIIHIAFCSEWGELLGHLKQLKNLRQLTFYDSDEANAFNSLISSLPVLEQLNLITSDAFLPNEIELWRIVATCSSLKILNISQIPIDYKFFDLRNSAMNRALRNRSQPLILHCCRSGEFEHLVSGRALYL